MNGCALVIDDGIGKPNDKINEIITALEAEGTALIKYNDMVDINTWNNFAGISFIILDWDIRGNEQTEIPQEARAAGVDVAATLKAARIRNNITFIKEMLKRYFVPVFIFTQQVIDAEVKPKLEADQQILSVLDRRVFVKHKNELTGKKVKIFLNNWLKCNRTVFALKMFEEQLNKSKNAFLIEVGDLNSEWANLVYNTIKLDHIGDDKQPIMYLLNSEFKDFLTSSLLGRMGYIDFNAVKFVSKIRKDRLPKIDVDKIYESIKFYKYIAAVDNGQAYEGDIYQLKDNGQFKNEYLLNINAPCDLRKDKIFLLVGRTKTKYRECGKSFYSLPCFAQKAAIEFRFGDIHRITKPADLSYINITDTQSSRNYERIGRITPPYITAIRSEFAHFISRQGIPRHPK